MAKKKPTGWKRHFNIVPNGPLSGATNNYTKDYLERQGDFAFRNYQSTLQDIYSGHQGRRDRYGQFEGMDGDSEINAALDILAEFCTQKNKETGTNFLFKFNERPTETETDILKEQLTNWYSLNELSRKMFKLVRNTFKFGDQIFVRDPETYKLFWVEMKKVTKIIVNESAGKEPEIYFIQDLNPNLQNDTITKPVGPNDTFASMPYAMGASTYSAGNIPNNNNRFSGSLNEFPVDAANVVHFSLTEGLDDNWPFGVSILESIFKVFKQKELLEDAMLMYRIQRAPERRVFTIDTGNMPPHLAMQFVERVKNEMQQRRIPSMSGGGDNIMDASYNPIGQNEDYFLATNSEGRGSKIEQLPGGCLVMDTKVPLLDGRVLTLSELTEEYKDGKQNWVYSTDPLNGHVVPGKVSWAGVTQESAKVMKLTLDNGEILTCTPDHKFPIIGKGFVQAKDLVIGESFIPWNTRNTDLGKNKKRSYTEVYQNDTKSWEFVHRMVNRELSSLVNDFVSDQTVNQNKTVIHHKNHDRYYNHKLVAIEYLTEPTEVGTLTIDVDEKYHNHHTFALEVGIFTKNSNIGEINDVQYFTNKLFRGLRIPSSYLPTGLEESGQVYTDGKVTTALIQEYRFNEYCKRLQGHISAQFDTEFKMFLKWRGFNIDSGLFDLVMSEPQNFASYRELELNTTRINTFKSISDVPYLSKRFMLKKYLQLSEFEIAENEKLLLEEKDFGDTIPEVEGSDLRSVGITPGSIGGDIDNFDEFGQQDENGGEDLGGEMMPNAPGDGAGLGPSSETGAGGPSGGVPGLS